MESSDEESTSGSEYCPSIYNDDSDHSEPEPDTQQQEICSTYNVHRIMNVKRKFFFDNPALQINSTEDNDNQLESSKKTESLQDDNG